MPLRAWHDRWFRSPRWDEVVYWALDLETTGVQAGHDSILAVGMAPIRGGILRYGERFDTYVRPDRLEGLPTAGIAAHHILPSELAGAPPLDRVIDEVHRRLSEGVLLVHCAALDIAFLKDAYERLARPWLRPRVVDTVDLLLAAHDRRHAFTPHPPAPGTGLADARAALGLPPHLEHDALADAVATAELFLALRARLGARTLRHLQ